MEAIRSYYEEEDAVSTIEIVLILVVLIALVVIFRRQLLKLINSVFNSINSSATEIYE